ncbi:D-glycero-D-manno-heptose 1,7-bisphosphate phosphatase [Sphingobacterium zeae]|uniref:D,D-heptose 1,7-bisphosphate phosphatase n=1 Tax=Sphingobacterium zeae TaxID=1776859 RepID=A0ABU0U3W0_9SPHI|nr:HAD family hydrolase [Sphingobacterium zeae]MDQ1149620.1 D-glycero-D-manno-heptose 1,7-bisphosphate phosphatase [Sphingobacterium zeae]
MEKALFLDKDGTLIKDVPYNVDPKRVVCYPDIFKPLRMLQKNGYKLIVVSNQSGIARRYFTAEELEIAFSELRKQLMTEGIHLNGIYYCPHGDRASDMQCICRKPLPGMLYQAAAELHIDLKKSWMIGDILNDVAAGRAAGCKTILVDRSQQERKKDRMEDPKFMPDFITDNFYGLTQVITLEKEYYE